MKITILTFGIAREICGARSFDLELPEGSHTDVLKQLLQENYPELKRLASWQLAVNETYAHENMPISNGDEIAILPPVSGG